MTINGQLPQEVLSGDYLKTIQLIREKTGIEEDGFTEFHTDYIRGVLDQFIENKDNPQWMESMKKQLEEWRMENK